MKISTEFNSSKGFCIKIIVDKTYYLTWVGTYQLDGHLKETIDEYQEQYKRVKTWVNSNQYIERRGL